MTGILAVVAVLAAPGLAHAQAATRPSTPPGTGPRFDVVSVKPTPAGTRGGGMRVSPGGRIAVTGSTLRGLIANAYQRYAWDSREIVGGPSWINDARFDIVAQAAGGLPPADADGFQSRLLLMFRAVLEDRFGVVVRWETRQRPIYNLVFARADRRLGPALTPVSVDCAAAAASVLAGRPVTPRAGRGQECNLSLTSDPGSVQANAVTPGVLARVLGSEGGVGREVVDRTGLSGLFDADLLFMPEIGLGGLSVEQMARDPRFQGRPGLFTAIREQLGLKLEPATGDVQVLVIEKAERPKAD